MKNSSLSEYFVCDEALNSQHALIVSCMDKVSTCFQAGMNGQTMFGLVDRLDAYCKLHFLEEENAMEALDPAVMESHKSQHALFVAHLERFMGRDDVENREEGIAEFNALKDWFLEHIVTTSP